MAYAYNQQRYLFDRATQVNNIILNVKVLELIGTGIKYPFQFDSIYGRLKSVEETRGLDKINGSIHHILATPIGSRFFNPEFGSMLPSLVFEPYDQILKDSLFLYTVEAIQRWEKRIRITGVWFDDTTMSQSQLGIGMRYNLINSSIAGNYVYPFYTKTESVT